MSKTKLGDLNVASPSIDCLTSSVYLAPHTSHKNKNLTKNILQSDGKEYLQSRENFK